jgi:hypothetical protein
MHTRSPRPLRLVAALPFNEGGWTLRMLGRARSESSQLENAGELRTKGPSLGQRRPAAGRSQLRARAGPGSLRPALPVPAAGPGRILEHEHAR